MNKKEKALDEYRTALLELDREVRKTEIECIKMLEQIKQEQRKLEKLKSEGITNIVDAYDNIIIPTELVKNMSYDDFIDWLELGSKQDIEAAIKVFERYNLTGYVEIMKIHLKRMI